MRKPRLEIEGGLYHIITRGNNRQLIFGSHDDYLKMLVLLAEQKAKLPFFPLRLLLDAQSRSSADRTTR